MSATGPKMKLKSLLKSFSDLSTARNNNKTDTNKLIQLSQFIEYLQSLKSEDILSISKGLEDALLNVIIPHPQVSNLVYRDLVAQICILDFKANMNKLRDFYIALQEKLQNNKSNSLRLTVLHVMGVLAANNPVLSQFLNDTCSILLRTAKSSSLSVRIAIVNALKNCIIGAQQGIKYAISDLMKLCDKISRDRDSRVRVALSQVILLMSHYYPDNLKEYISLIRKQCTVKHHNVRHAFGDILGKILARSIPADIETAKREKRRRQKEKEDENAAKNGKNSKKNKAHENSDSDHEMPNFEESSLAKSIIDFESGFFAALTLFDKLRNATSGVNKSKNCAYFGLTAGTQCLMSFLKECMLLSRFESTRLSYVIKQILKKLKQSKTKNSINKQQKIKLKSMGKMIIKGTNINSSVEIDADDGIVSCMSYALRYGLFKYLDQSSQSKSIRILCDFISETNGAHSSKQSSKKRNRCQIYLCLNEIGYILHSLQCGCCEQKQINDIFLMCLRFTTHNSHAIRNRAAQCLSMLAVSNSDQVFVWADGLIKEISATLSTIDSSDPSKMYLLHGRSIALSEIIKIIPQLQHGIPHALASQAFGVAVDLFNVDIQEDVSFNLEASSILTVCGWVLVDSLIHLGTSWANSKIKTLLNIWRDVFSQTEFTPSTSSEAISLIYVKQAAYHSMLTFVRVFEKQIPIHPDLQTQIVKRLQHALDFEKFINGMIHDHNKKNENILTPAVRHQLSRLRALMMNIFAFLPPTMYERHVTLLKLANANFSHRKAVTSNELEHLLDYEDDILSLDDADNILVAKSCSELNIFIEYMSNPTIDELGLDKSWMPQDLIHSNLFKLGVIHDKNQLNLHKSTRITSMLADINDATHTDGSPEQIQTISPHLSYTHYVSSSSSSADKNEMKLLRSMTIGGIMMNESDIHNSSSSKQQQQQKEEEDDEKKEENGKKKESEKDILTKAKQRYHNKILATLQIAQSEQSMRLIPRLTMSYFQKENCDANLRLFCKLFPFQNEGHKLKLVQHFVEVAKDAKQSEKSESLKIVLQNSAAVILGCCKCMLENGILFGKGKVRDSVLRIASDFLAFSNTLVMRAGAQIFGILSRIEDDAFKTTIIQYLYKKKFGEERANIRAASALALGCIHQYSASKENLGFTVAALQLLERDGNVSLWLLHSLQRILRVVNLPTIKKNDVNNNNMNGNKQNKKKKEQDDDEAICRNILGFTLSILADEKDSVDSRVLNALLEILNILLSRIVNKQKNESTKECEPNSNLLNTIIFMMKFIERLNIPSLHSKLLECSSKIAQCSPKSIVNLDSNDKNANNENNDALDAQQYIIHQLQRCLFSGDLKEKVSAMDALQTFAKHSPSILVSKNILHSLLYLLDVNATVPIIYHRALSALQAVTSLYGQKYPQSLLKYFRTISLRGMQIKPPEISQIISLLAQDLAIKKITKSKSSDNEWVIIPPSLPCLRYTSLLWIQCVTQSMIAYAVKKGGHYMDVRLAQKAENENKEQSEEEEESVNISSSKDFEYLILSMSDLVQLVCRDAGSKYCVVRKKALQCLHAIIIHFSHLPDPDAGYDGEFLLNQFRAQIHPAMRCIISSETDPSIRFMSAELAVDYINCPLSTEEMINTNFVHLFQIFELQPGKHFKNICSVYEPHVKTMVILQHLMAICTLYNRVFFKEYKAKIPFVKLLKSLFEPKLCLLKSLTEQALMDYVVVTSSTRKTIRDYCGNFFVGSSYRRVRQCYIESFALLLQTLSRLVSSKEFKKNVDVSKQMIDDRIAVTLFATSLYCLQDCLVRFSANNEEKSQQNELPKVQDSCIDLLCTLTSIKYVKLIDEDMLFDLLSMIHGGIKHQISVNTANFEWNKNLAHLLYNCTDTILQSDLMENDENVQMNLSKLMSVIVNCWIDAINEIICFVSTTYDESPFLAMNGSTKKKNAIIVCFDENLLSSFYQIIEVIHKYNVRKQDEQEIDYKNWALSLSDWSNAITAISMLLSTAYKPSSSNKSLSFLRVHKTQCMQLLDALLCYELYTKPDPNNPNFNLNCMKLRGCVHENIKYLMHSLSPQQPQSQNDDSESDEYYASIVVIMYKLAHCAMNVSITEEKQDDDEKLNDRQSIESVETLRDFVLNNIRNAHNQKYVIEALAIVWKKLFEKIENYKMDKLKEQIQRKYSEINMEIETLIILLPHIVMMLSQNNALFNKHFVNSLLDILQIFEVMEAASKRFEKAQTCLQLNGVIIPLLVKYVVDDNESQSEENENENEKKKKKQIQKVKDLIVGYIAAFIGTNNNLLDAVKSLPRTIVAELQKQLNSVSASSPSSYAKKAKKKKKDEDKESEATSKDEHNNKMDSKDEDYHQNGVVDDEEKAKKEKRKKKKKKKKKKRKKKAVQDTGPEPEIDFAAF